MHFNQTVICSKLTQTCILVIGFAKVADVLYIRSRVATRFTTDKWLCVKQRAVMIDGQGDEYLICYFLCNVLAFLCKSYDSREVKTSIYEKLDKSQLKAL